MKNQNFGIEIEMTGITRSTAAKVIAGYFHTDATHVGGCYDAYSVRDNDGRMWKIMRDASVRCENRSGQNASSLYSVEFVTPICNYDDIETIQELVRKLRGAGARVNSSCGLHCHINAAPHTPENTSQYRKHYGGERGFALQGIKSECIKRTLLSKDGHTLP